MLLLLRKYFAGVVVGAVAASTAALAQLDVAASNGVRIFEPAYFVEFDPNSALEMVFRTPGFNPQESDGGRGLAGVRSNILIDGVRPPPKGQSIQQQLRETPVAGVAWIELIDAGARLDIDMQGYPQVVNVVTVTDAPAYYEVVTQLDRIGAGDPEQQNMRDVRVEATGSFSWNRHDFKLAGDVGDRYNEEPADLVDVDPANPTQRLSSPSRFERTGSGLDLNAVFDLSGSSSLTLNGRFSAQEISSRSLPLDDDGDGTDFLDQRFEADADGQDLSAEYRRPLATNGEVMLAFVDARSVEQTTSALIQDGLVRSSANESEAGETAARMLVTNAPTERVTIRTTVTSALNYFDGRFRLFENGVELPVAGSDSRVEEDRRSLSSAVDWTFSDKWLFRGSLGVETYAIEARDVSSGLQADPKGGITISYRPGQRTTLSFESTREIGQLSFGQYLASSNLSSEILTEGATELEPVRRWIHTASYDKRFGDVGVLRVELSREERDNPIRTVALSDSRTVSQNTSPQRIDRLELNADYPFASFGREDLILSVRGAVTKTDTIDPVTGEGREVSGNPWRFWSVEFRRDPRAADLAWGVFVSRQNRGYRYWVREIREEAAVSQWGAYVEWEPIDGLRLRTNVDGPRTEFWGSRFFPAVRRTDLDPSFFSGTTREVDASASFTVEWRRQRHLEIRATLGFRPEILTEQVLTPFGAPVGTLLATGVDDSPRAVIRIRAFR